MAQSTLQNIQDTFLKPVQEVSVKMVPQEGPIGTPEDRSFGYRLINLVALGILELDDEYRLYRI